MVAFNSHTWLSQVACTSIAACTFPAQRERLLATSDAWWTRLDHNVQSVVTGEAQVSI
jgi:hypothetical protein